MIAKGNIHANGGKLAEYMVTGKDGEQARLHELRGFASDDIRAAFRDVHLMAAATQCDNPFFHVQVRNPLGDKLSPTQWEQVAERIERINGLSLDTDGHGIRGTLRDAFDRYQTVGALNANYEHSRRSRNIDAAAPCRTAITPAEGGKHE